MIKKIVSGITLLIWIASLFLRPTPGRADSFPELVLDRDGDGLPDSVEIAGWRNAAGGPFITQPLDPDSDDDGLTDGEEKLFNTHPLSKSSPGIFVEYQAGFKTKEYFHSTNNAEPAPPAQNRGPTPQTLGGGYLHWDEGGSRHLLSEGTVVRRGTTFRLIGPPGASLSISKYDPSQSDLVASPNFCEGGWDITVDPNETVGVYTATMSLGAWSDELPVYVIFELPTPFNGTGIN